MIPPIFASATVCLVAGGPSLKNFDWSRLHGRQVIAINRAFETCPQAQVLWWSDHLFYLRNREAIDAHAAPYKATGLRSNEQHADLAAEVHRYRFTGLHGLDAEPGCVRTGNNSAFAALHLAAHLGARKIVLLGVDMKHGAAGETHWHNGHGIAHIEHTLTHQMLPYFESLKEPLAALGIEVLNANPESALLTWPRMTFDQALAT